MALRHDEIRETQPVALWQRDRGYLTFLDHRRDYPDPLAAAQHEARENAATSLLLAEDNAHLVAVIARLEAARRHNDAVFLPRVERLLARKNERIARAEALAWVCVALAGLVALIALGLWLVVVGWV